jgi:hypothetical protein
LTSPDNNIVGFDIGSGMEGGARSELTTVGSYGSNDVVSSIPKTIKLSSLIFNLENMSIQMTNLRRNSSRAHISILLLFMESSIERSIDSDLNISPGGWFDILRKKKHE